MHGVMQWKLFAQYCAFSRKKQGGDLMASHSEDLYSSVQKAAEYTFYLRERAAEWMQNTEDQYWRIFNWQPVVVVQNDLFVLTEPESGASELTAVTEARLLFNFHYKGAAKSVVASFVTEAGLPEFARQILARDEAVEQKILASRLKPAPTPR